MATAILTFGSLLAEALEALLMGVEFAGEASALITDGAALGQEVIRGTISAIQAVINAYNNNPDRRHLFALPQDLTTTTSLLTQLSELLTTKGQNVTVEELQPIYNNLMNELRLVPLHNPADWEAYEIEPPCNPTFKPRKIEKIPENMELYEVACPTRFAGVNPKKECEKAKCCKQVKPKCKKRRSSRKSCCA